MPTFEIPDGPTTVDLQGTGDEKNPGPATGSVVFNVTNKSAESADGSLSIQVAGSTKKEWFTIEGDQVRTFAGGETQTAKINVSVPKDAAPGDYPFRLRAAAVRDPDNDAAEGPVSVAKKKEAAVVVTKSHWWIWLIVALVVLAIIGAAVYFFVLRPDGEPTPQPAPPTAETKVPKFIDQNVDSIAANAGGYQIVKNETANTNRQPRIVYDQDPKPDAALAAGQRVIVSYEPGVVVPDLPANATFSNAPNILRGAGLQPGNFFCDNTLSGTPGAPVGKVTKFYPASGTRVAANSQVGMYAVQATRCMSRLIDRHRLEATVSQVTAVQKLNLQLPH